MGMTFKDFDKETGAKMLEILAWYRKILGLNKEKKEVSNDR